MKEYGFDVKRALRLSLFGAGIITAVIGGERFYTWVDDLSRSQPYYRTSAESVPPMPDEIPIWQPRTDWNRRIK